jgi:proteasome lid subunit RPN8/RPN11
VSCTVHPGALAAIVAHAEAERPRECCGVLLGSGAAIVEAIGTGNLAAAADRFVIDPKGHFDALRAGRARGLDVVGFYHSHPAAPAVPSSIDLAEASYPEHFYLIVSLLGAQPDARLYWLEGGAFHPRAFETKAEANFDSV